MSLHLSLCCEDSVAQTVISIKQKFKAYVWKEYIAIGVVSVGGGKKIGRCIHCS